ncbi:MAG: sulfite exporter TauE/SafE family protein [Acidimicrobiales bacterium]|nr:sulfite exporter TauE/SafE family protein [Acidimicrobiales bacterium]MYB82431.1 sulfite exporter TauE/SafE family protein [Acidimicrobiales bacterium]MYI13030.1 sulfite exporter TauE/SafE family protein [Acidimicrobiales bacterium]
MDAAQIALVAGAGVVAGVVNAMAGGGSLLTVSLLTVVGDLGGLTANGTNRIGVVVQNVASVAGYRSEGVSGLRRSVPVLIPAVVGSVIGAYAVSSLLSDTAFERVFGILLVPLLILSLKPPKARSEHITWPMWLTVVVFFLIGAYGGAFQAGVGLVLVLALSHAGLDLVNANAVKVVVIAVLTVVAVPVFILNDQVHWGFALIVAAGFAVGGWLGARWAVRSGERLIRPVLAVAVLGLAGRMIGLY